MILNGVHYSDEELQIVITKMVEEHLNKLLPEIIEKVEQFFQAKKCGQKCS